MSTTLSALFEERSDAIEASNQLMAIGIPASDIKVTGKTAGVVAEDKGFWESLGDFFFPDDDREVYAEGLRRGDTLLTVTNVDPILQDEAADILEGKGTIDIDERVETWRKEGWEAPARQPENPPERLTAEGDTVIPIVEEKLRVGKRDITNRRTSVKSYVVETPVKEEVTLRTEKVSVERRPVDRKATEAEIAGQETTVEAVEHREEPVVAKDARVIEEVIVKKDVEDVVETVSGTVRRTEVDVDEDKK